MSSSSERIRRRRRPPAALRQALPSADPEQVADRDQHPRLGEHRVHLGLQPATHGHNFGPIRINSRKSRVSGGAIHASGSRFIRSRSAKSAASRTSFFTRRYRNPLTPNG